ncbi:hypothetical protein FYJ38_00235 [Clostridium sp. WB02_MRS01]|uniref:hypothetical protein n=1 Tax=Clostridium sp. WB02_MRS01 TaxID=2605777 RepID=UPI0012B222E7|nr:hypothetical protein [Clostridium sp. WB02_MRS01]MSS07066.1 hypothetical protein [Clostridium sp. WB02_MRS01]
MKVLGTNTGLPYEMLQKISKLSDKELHHNQFRIICKCKGIADANRKCKEEGLASKVFSPGWTSITGNKTELELCEKEDIWICKNGTLGDAYVSIKELQ